MSSSGLSKRNILAVDVSDFTAALQTARNKFRAGHFLEACDIYEQLVDSYPKQSTDLLAEVYDCSQLLPNKARYNLYQARFFDFNINSADKVLDIGSGNLPFPYATHLADFAIDNDYYGRAGVPFKHVDGKPRYECSVENLPFEDKEFDFIYCSHVLEHVGDPQRACDELMRVGKRGYIETPTRAKDLFFNVAKTSNHKWSVELAEDVLVFDEYTQREIEGLNCDILLRISCGPQTKREKAVNAIVLLKADRLNTMLLWENSFKCQVHRLNQQPDRRRVVPSPDSKRTKELFKKGLQFLRMGNAQEAVKCFDEMTVECPTLPDLHFARATALVQIGKLSLAKEACQAELRLHPKHDSAKKFLERIEEAVKSGSLTSIGRGDENRGKEVMNCSKASFGLETSNNQVIPVSAQLCENLQSGKGSLPLTAVENGGENRYGQEYFDWQKNIGSFGGIANLFKFADYIRPDFSVVDFGCGGGYLLRNIKCKEKMGIEVNAYARQEAKNSGIKAVESIDEVPDNHADVIISNHTLEHVEDPVGILRALRDKLKGDGKIVFVMPHQDIRERYDPDDINKHLYTWNQLTLGNLFSMAGYKVLRVEAFQHQWPPGYLEIYSQYGEEEFHRRCREYAVKNNNYQIRIVAVKT
jgi:2-polyprenyl-3-methyl-5-hydroxy-6-metoxy-1,4-benzoquinol methylase